MIISYAFKLSYIEEVSHTILPNSLNNKGWSCFMRIAMSRVHYTSLCVEIPAHYIFNCFPPQWVWVLQKLSIFLWVAMHFGQISACISQWLLGIPRWREMFPKSSCSSKIWNKVTKCWKTAENALCPIHFPFAKTCFEAINLGEAILKAGFKSKNSKVKVRELMKT